MGRKRDFLMMAVAGGVGVAIYVGQSFRMAEIAGLADGQVQGYRRIRFPAKRDLKPGAEDKIGIRLTPVGPPGDRGPVPIVNLLRDRRIDLGTRQPAVPERGQRMALMVNQRLDQHQALPDLF
jgi:hypothetical protein